MRDHPFNLESPASPRGVFCWLRFRIAGAALLAFCVLLATLALAQPATAEVFVTPEQLAQRLAAELQRTEDARADSPETPAMSEASGNWHDAVRPLLILHVEHDRTGYDRAHLPGAVFFEGRLTYDYDREIGGCLPPTGKLATILAEHGVGPGMDVLLYGEGAGLFPARVYAALALLGLDENTRLLDGHKRVWKAQNRPLTDVAHPPTPVPALPVPNDTGRVLREGPPTSWAGPVVTLDARTPKAFSGQHTLPKSNDRGHLPGSVNRPWIPLIENMRRPVLAASAKQQLRDAIHAAVQAESPQKRDQIEPPPFEAQHNFRVVILDDRGNAAPALFAIARHFGWDAYLDERGILGRIQDGQAVVTLPTPTPSTDAKP